MFLDEKSRTRIETFLEHPAAFIHNSVVLNERIRVNCSRSQTNTAQPKPASESYSPQFQWL